MAPAARNELAEIVDAFSQAPLFAELAPRHLKRLARFSKVLDLAPGAPVVKRGEKGIGFYVILKGRVDIRKAGRSVARLGRGDFFGELALFDDRVRSADVVPLEPTRVAVLSRWEFWGFASNRPTVIRTILAEMARRLQESAPSPSH